MNLSIEAVAFVCIVLSQSHSSGNTSPLCTYPVSYELQVTHQVPGQTTSSVKPALITKPQAKLISFFLNVLIHPVLTLIATALTTLCSHSFFFPGWILCACVYIHVLIPSKDIAIDSREEGR